MRKGKGLWLGATLAWLAFAFWYTDLGGPLTDAEVNSALGVLEARGMEADRLQEFERFLREDTGRQFLMVNNIDLRDRPPPMPAFDGGGTAQEYSDYYMEHMYPELLRRACHPVFFGEGLGGVAVDVAGIEGARGWDMAALFRYKSRRAFVEIITHPAMGERHAYKLAAMEKTVAYPVEPGLFLSDLRVLLFLLLALAASLLDGWVVRRPG